MDVYKQNAPHEQAVALNYTATANHDLNLGYQDPALGRIGNRLHIQIYLPNRMAEEIAQMIQEDPLFVRKLAYAAARENYIEDFIRMAWEGHNELGIKGAPPYEKWDTILPEQRLLFLNRITQPDFTITSQKELDDHVIIFRPHGSINKPEEYYADAA